MENSKKPGYITEKILNAFNGGAIPIYWGDSDIAKQWFNTKAYIDVSDFTTLEEAADYIVKLSYNPQKIAEMQSEPIFKNNVIPEILQLDKDHNSIIAEAATKVRQKYFKAIEKNNSNFIKTSWFKYLRNNK